MSVSTLQNSLVKEAAHENEHEHHDHGTKLGLWIYLMSDCILFGTFFATYAVLSSAYAGGPSPKDIFEMPYVLTETFMLLLSSITCGFVMLTLRQGKKNQVIFWLVVTFIFGLAFVGMEINEFHHLIINNAGPNRSAYLSAFFTLVATHGLHVTFGLVWMGILIHQIITRGINGNMPMRLECLSMFWHFLDLVWICVFTIVYLLGVY